MISNRIVLGLAVGLLVLAGSRVDAADVTLAWDPASGAARYGVMVGAVSRQYTSEQNAGSNTTFTVQNLLPGRGYYFAVRSYDSAGTPSAYSNEVFFVIPQDPPATYTSAIIWQNEASGWLAAWYMNGTSLGVSSYLSPNLISDTSWKIAASGDFNSDGRKDLLWRQTGSGLLVIWYMNGLYLDSSAYTYPNSVPDMNWVVEGTGDLSGDGRSDILWRNRVTGQLLVWAMDGRTRTSAVFLNPDRVADTQWYVAGIGDFNNDGRGDLLWRNTAGSLYVWFMNGTTRTSGAYLTPNFIDPAWRIATVGDIDGDGRTDLIWRHSTGGWLTAWFLNGTTLSRSAFLNPDRLTDMSWAIRGVF